MSVNTRNIVADLKDTAAAHRLIQAIVKAFPLANSDESDHSGIIHDFGLVLDANGRPTTPQEPR
ncbi:MAG: hypothetical protein JWM41_2867 [Gemmatimonadetes bacterium]|nr:hypothetical protein [Gemmatimonadota bacterium]